MTTKPNSRCRLAVSLLSVAGSLLCPFLVLSAFSQSSQEKPALKDFGSSLKRLKWDPAKQAAVEVTPEEKKQDSAADEELVRIETQLVVCDVLVRDQKGNVVPGLTQNDFIVTDAGAARQISHFSVGDKVHDGRSIVLIVDYSISQFPYIKTSVDAAKLLVDELGPKDRMAIVTDDVDLLVDFTGNKADLKRGLDSLKMKVALGQTGGSAQFSALMATLKEMFSVENTRRIVIFQTDGDELQLLQPPTEAVLQTPQLERRIRPFGLNDISAAAEKTRATIYSILSGVRLLGLPTDEQLEKARTHHKQAIDSGYQLHGQTPPTVRRMSQSFLATYAERMVAMQSAVAGLAVSSGGWTAYLEQPDQAAEIFANIISDVNRRYVIGFYPDRKKNDGKRHRVIIQVANHPEYVVEGRKTYLAPAPDAQQ
jgi:VWFA-related protein